MSSNIFAINYFNRIIKQHFQKQLFMPSTRTASPDGYGFSFELYMCPGFTALLETSNRPFYANKPKVK